MSNTNTTYLLNFLTADPEARLGLLGKKYTAVTAWAAAFLGAVFTALFYGALLPLHNMHRWWMVDMFFHGGPERRSVIPYFTMFLTFWCLAILFVKWRRLRAQRRALEVRVTPDAADFTISRLNAGEIVAALHEKIFMSERFMALWRIECALSNLNNIGRISEVSSVMNDLAENDANFTEGTYTLPKGMVWAIPVLGFIGTVLGLSQAVGGFGAVVSSGADLETLKNSLAGVTSGLGTAFETTLIALLAALAVQLLMTVLSQKEEEFLDECSAFCYRNVTSKLKMLDLNDTLS